ncbi:MAG: hypothetical protein ACI9M9_001136 [Flavobacteriaceae bacterium]|jgi:hypothetical protein
MFKIKKRIKRHNITYKLVLFMAIIISNNGYAQDDKTTPLINIWHLDTYVMDGQEYRPEKKEKDDYILFKEDMTYTSKSEGTEETGTFILNNNGAYILMSDKSGEKIKAYIVSVSKKSLILKYDINEIRDVEVHYNSPIQ